MAYRRLARPIDELAMDRRTTLLVGLLLATAAVTVPACAYYCDAACYAGFQLSLVASEGLTPGEYTLALDIEDQAHQLACTVAADGTGECVDGDTISEFRVYGGVARDDDGLIGIGVSVEGSLDQRGPDRLAVEVLLADEVVGAADYEPEYEREPTCNCLGTSPQTLALDLD